MKNIDKADKALSKVMRHLVVCGRKIDIEDGVYYESTDKGDMMIYSCIDGCQTCIKGYLSYNGWNDGMKISISATDSVADIERRISNMVLRFYKTFGFIL